MRNNLLNFAEFERETIAGRVADAYNTRSRETGFFQGRIMSFGYTTQRMTVNGKKGSVLVPSEQAEALKLAYQMYAEPSTSLRDIIRYFSEHEDSVHYLRTDEYGGKNDSHSGKLNVSSLSSILKNPLYVRADKAVYAYFQARAMRSLTMLMPMMAFTEYFCTIMQMVGNSPRSVITKVWLTAQYGSLFRTKSSTASHSIQIGRRIIHGSLVC